jgi:hypothetical protein
VLQKQRQVLTHVNDLLACTSSTVLPQALESSPSSHCSCAHSQPYLGVDCSVRNADVVNSCGLHQDGVDRGGGNVGAFWLAFRPQVESADKCASRVIQNVVVLQISIRSFSVQSAQASNITSKSACHGQLQSPLDVLILEFRVVDVLAAALLLCDVRSRAMAKVGPGAQRQLCACCSCSCPCQAALTSAQWGSRWQLP